MKNGETYGVSIELLLSKFNSKLNQASQMAKNAGQKIKDSIKINGDTGLKFNVNDNDAMVKIAQLKETMKEANAIMQGEDIGSEKWVKYANVISQAKKELKELNDELRKTGNESEKASAKSNKLSGIGNTFKKGIHNVRRYILALFSVRSVFSMISRASQAYLAQDTELANKLQSVWAGLGAFFAPIIEKIANWLIKLVSYLNVFIKAVTGQDLLAKASAKATANIKKQTKATKDLNKSLSSMDEITNIDDPNQNMASDTPENPFANFDADKVELDPKIVKFLEDLGGKIKHFWEDILQPFFNWLKKNWTWVLPLIVTAGVVIALLIKKITKTEKLKKAATDFTGFFDKLGTAIEAIAILGGIALVLREVSNLIKAFGESGLKVGDVALMLVSVFGTLAAGFALVALATKLLDIKGAIAAIVVLAGLALVLSQVAKVLTAVSKTGMTAGDIFKTMAGIMGTVLVFMAAMVALAFVLGSNPLALIGILALTVAISAVLIVMAKTIPTILDAVSKFVVKTGPTLIAIINTIADAIVRIIYALGTNLPPIINSVSRAFTNIFNTIWNAFKSLINFVIKGINVLISGLNKIKVKTPDWVPLVGGKEVGFNLKKIPLLNVGTNYVPEDQLAMIHKGEAVIPKKFNSAEYFSNVNNNEETNALLLDLNRTMNQLLDKDTNLYINGKELARSTYKDFKNEGQRLGSSSVVTTR